MLNDDTLVLVPIWVLKTKVEADRIDHILNYAEDEDDYEQFPSLDTTIKMLQILEEEGIKFNKKTGEWE